MTQSTTKEPRMTVKDLGALMELAAMQMTEQDLAACALTVGRLGDRYTMVNRFAIFAQCPNAVEVHGFRAWQQHGRKVAKGQRGLGIFAPVTRRQQAGDEAAPAEQGKDQQPSDGTETGGAARRLSGYRVAYVWDISQTVPLDCACPNLAECRCPRPATSPQGPAADADEIRELLEQLTESGDGAEV